MAVSSKALELKVFVGVLLRCLRLRGNNFKLRLLKYKFLIFLRAQSKFPKARRDLFLRNLALQLPIVTPLVISSLPLRRLDCASVPFL